MSDLDQLEIDMIRLSELRKLMEPYDDLKKEEAELRQAILMGMQAQRSKRTEAINGYFAVRQERATIRITDERKVEKWLRDNEFDLDEFKRIDATRFDPVAKIRLKEAGELIPGTNLDVSETVSIRKEKTDANTNQS